MIYAIVFIVFMGTVSAVGITNCRSLNERINCSDSNNITTD
ncbi:hypothetical protein [Breznakia pachnodae]|uniref:NADH dehydrogenase subunit 4L n=1 Tax=Breznakia pachnodae TaxID=265178 RepID=A0ABU0E7U9_9FIRM|nr:hypothetical protein [Breznakia pachnodae]MDQ0362570.1 hypothetical protein [Breznakia pachnodae]